MSAPFRSLAALALLFAAASCIFGGGGPTSGGAAPAPRTRESAGASAAPLAADSVQIVEADALQPAARAPELAARPALAEPLAADAPIASDTPPVPPAPVASGEPDKEFEGEGLSILRGEGKLGVWVPKAEHLEFDVLPDLPIVGKVVAGQVVLEARVEAYVPGLPTAGASSDAPRKWMGSVDSLATGSALGYTLHEELKSRLLPQDFPRVFYTDTQTGSENRRKETKLGLLDGKQLDTFRGDGHCKGCNNREHFVDSNWIWGKPSHCDGCKRGEHRVWKPVKQREVPADTLDMLSAVYLARTMVREGRMEESLQLVDELTLWNVQLTQGVHKRIEVPAGKFDCVEVRLKSSVPKGEPAPKGGFEGLFGLKGTIQVWLDARDGVPVQIQGEFPIKFLSTALDVYVQLKSYRGTPKTFGPALK